MTKTLLIVEEALRDLKAHWFEYIKTIAQAAETQNWSVDVACHQAADPDIQTAFSTFPIFHYARYLDNNTQKLPGERYYGFILHSFRCLTVLWSLLAKQKRYDHIFVPTVLVHHLLAWWIIAQFHPHKPHHLTLFFVTNPGSWNQQTKTSFLPKSSQLLALLLRGFRKLVQQGRVTLGVETKGAKREFESLTGLPFKLLPHPVPQPNAILEETITESTKPHTICLTNKVSHQIFNLESSPQENQSALATLNSTSIHPTRFACYGFARYEKGSDLLKAALEHLLKDQPDLNAQFRIQWTDPFGMPDGSLCEPSLFLTNHPQVSIINRPLLTDDYQALLHTTDCMILPYRNSSYYARVSRVAIEAACLGIPMIYTKGGWLEETVMEFGAGIGIEDENVDELFEAIKTMLSEYAIYHKSALMKRERARQYFSGESFCRLLFANKLQN